MPVIWKSKKWVTHVELFCANEAMKKSAANRGSDIQH